MNFDIANPMLLLVGLVAFGASTVLIVRYPWFRLGFVTLGSILVVGGSRSVSLAEVGFLACAAIAMVIAVFNIEKEAPPWAKSVARIAYVYGAVLVFSAGVGLLRGNEFVNVVRDAASYGFLVVVVVVAIDAGRSMLDRAVMITLGTTAIVSLAFYVPFWLHRRGAIRFEFISDAFVRTSLVALAFWCVSLASFVRRGSFWWLVPIYSIPLLLIATGTRQHALYVIAPLVYAVVVAVTDSWRDHWRRWVAVVAVGAVLAVGVGGAVLATDLTIRNAKIASRLVSALEVLEDPFDLPSLDARREVTQESWELFTEYPIVGAGLGTTFTFVPRNPDRESFERLTVDTSVSSLGKLGILGAAAALVFIVSTVRLSPMPGRWKDGLIVFLVMCIPYGLLTSLLGNKGFAVALGLLVAGCVAWRAAIPEAEALSDDGTPSPA